jgi:hypothetical protein
VRPVSSLPWLVDTTYGGQTTASASRVRIGWSTAAGAVFHVPPAGSSIGGTATPSPGVPVRAFNGVSYAGQARV